MATEPAAKQQRSNKSLKIKYKALKELKSGTPYKDVASLFGVLNNTFSTWKKQKQKQNKTKKKSSNRMKVALGLKG